MRILYECEKLAILQEEDLILIHVLDNYRFVKEIKTNKDNLRSILKKEFHHTEFKKSFVFGKNIKRPVSDSLDVEQLLNYI